MDVGRKFVILYCPWLWIGTGTFRVCYDPQANKAKWFENLDNKVQEQICEIQLFVKGMKVQCSNTSTHLHHQCTALFNVAASELLLPDTRQEQFRERIGWVYDSHGSRSYSSVDVEILHKDYKGSFDYDMIFLNPILMRVFVAIIRGLTAAIELMNGVVSYPKMDTMARKHGIRHTTPGAIATSVILAWWTLSADQCLQSMGVITGINYAKDLDEYLEILTKGLQKRKKGIIEVFCHVPFYSTRDKSGGGNSL
ncbi:hypothetical protein BDQ17DRAFT_1229965 [Cyathus striatus]|nr:hypothetical protein BDQ17DRAFT_1229965 [Cyathus striatus]